MLRRVRPTWIHSNTTSGVTERLGALGHSDTLGPNLSWAIAGYNILNAG